MAEFKQQSDQMSKISRTGSMYVAGQAPSQPDALDNAVSGLVGADSLPNVAKEGRIFGIALLAAQAALFVVYLSADVVYTGLTGIADWVYLRDITFMVLFGFSFLMTFLRRYGQSAIAYTFLILILTVQWSVLVRNGFKETHNIDIHYLRDGVFCAASILISFGVVLGRLSPLEILILVVCETLCFNLNVWSAIDDQKAYDVGGGATIHLFGAMFGLAMSKVLGDSSKAKNHNDNASTYSSDLFSLAGTLVLWCYWPSFNAAATTQTNGAEYAIVNTYMSIAASCAVSFAASRLFVGHGRLNVVHIQNATLAGGVAMGVIADVYMTPAVAMATGACAGLVSVLGFRFVTPFLESKLGIQDVCGVNNLHGLPGLISIGFAIVAAPIVDDKRTPSPFAANDDIAGKEVLLLVTTLIVGLGGGMITGLLMRVTRHLVHTIPRRDIFNDRAFWEIPTDYGWVVAPQPADDDQMEDSSAALAASAPAVGQTADAAAEDTA